jgi:hypothetical protein
MEEIKPIRNAVHVCSLNTSAIKRIAAQAVESAEDGDKDTACRLRWLAVAMEYNRHTQMQYIFQTLGSKEKSPKFRAVRMGPFWQQWKRQSLRSDWATIRECVDKRAIGTDLKYSSRFFESQRVELAARAFQNSEFLKKMPISAILTPKPVEALYPFTTPGSTRPGYFNQGYNYVESAALTTMSDVSDSETETQEIDPWDRPLEDRFKEKAAERHFKNVNFTQPEGQEHIRSRGVPDTNNPSLIKDEKKGKENEKKERSKKSGASMKRSTIIKGAVVVAAVVLIIFVLLYFFKSSPPPPPVKKGKK